jgi:MerR family transcriptional regulator, light-induced transcriptional regulator
MSSALNIAALARRTGVQPDTLRKWEHRYGVIRPERTPGGQRRYSALDVARVEWLQARLAEGYRIGEAAALLGSDDLPTAPQTPEELRAALLQAVRETDVPTVERLVEHALSVNPPATAVDEVLSPLLEQVGEGWAAGELSIGQEHLVSGIVRAHLERRLTDARGPIRGVAVLACAPGERHELGLLMLALLLRADGWQVRYLGADTPIEDAARLAEEVSAALVCVSASVATALPALGSSLERSDLPHGTRLVLGGRAVTEKIASSFGAETAPDIRSAVALARG